MDVNLKDLERLHEEIQTLRNSINTTAMSHEMSNLILVNRVKKLEVMLEMKTRGIEPYEPYNS